MAKTEAKKEVLQYGIREISETLLYPIPVSYRREFKKTIESIFESIGNSDDGDAAFFGSVYQAVDEHLPKLLFVSTGIENMDENMSFEQAADAIEKFIALNFGDELQKKIKGWMDKIPKIAVEKVKATASGPLKKLS